MINLLPPDSTKEIRAARHNVMLLRFVIANGIVLGLIVIVYVVAFGFMKATEMSSNDSSSENQQRIAELDETAKTAKAYTTNLGLAKSIFDSELSHTAALQKIAAALPEGTVISSLTLDASMVNQPTSLLVLAKSQAAALAVRGNFEREEIASDITIANITTESAAPTEGAAPSPYPVSINLNLTFNPTVFKHEVEAEDE